MSTARGAGRAHGRQSLGRPTRHLPARRRHPYASPPHPGLPDPQQLLAWLASGSSYGSTCPRHLGPCLFAPLLPPASMTLQVPPCTFTFPLRLGLLGCCGGSVTRCISCPGRLLLFCRCDKCASKSPYPSIIMSNSTGPGAELRGLVLEFCSELIHLSQASEEVVRRVRYTCLHVHLVSVQLSSDC